MLAKLPEGAGGREGEAAAKTDTPIVRFADSQATQSVFPGRPHKTLQSFSLGLGLWVSSSHCMEEAWVPSLTENKALFLLSL